MAHAITSWALIGAYTLEVPCAWYGLNAHELTEMQNGIGPDRWPEARRRVFDAATGFRPAADVHDVDYCLGRTRKDRKDADRRFFRNCLRIILHDNGGWLGLLIRGNWRASFTRALVAWGMYRALRAGGSAAFREATKVDATVRPWHQDAADVADKQGWE